MARQASHRGEIESLESGIAGATSQLRDADRVLLLPHVVDALKLATTARGRALKWIELACAQLLADLGVRPPFDRPLLTVTRIALAASTRETVHLAAALVALSPEIEWLLAPRRQHERQLVAAARAVVRHRRLSRKSRGWSALIRAVAALRLGVANGEVGA